MLEGSAATSGFPETLKDFLPDKTMDISGKRLVIRTDASAEIGTGHVMRCQALAQAWQDIGGRSMFLMTHSGPIIEKCLRAKGLEVLNISGQPGSLDDAKQTSKLAANIGASWVVVDGYRFGADYQQYLKDARLSVLVVDDYGSADYYWADLVLNQNIHANEGLYTNRSPYTKLLLGTRYVLLRREFLKWRDWKRKIPNLARRVLVTLGGADPDNVTLKVIEAVQQVQIDGLEVVVVIGASNPHEKTLNCAVQNSQVPIRLHSNVTNMPELMAWADISIIAAGGTLWESLYLQSAVISYTWNSLQEAVVRPLELRGVLMHQGNVRYLHASALALTVEAIALSKPQRHQMRRAGRLIVDGDGTSRVLNALAGRGYSRYEISNEAGIE